MLPLLGWEVEAGQFDQMLIERVRQSENDLFNELPGIRHFQCFIDLHFYLAIKAGALDRNAE